MYIKVAANILRAMLNRDGLGYIKVAANIAPTAFQLYLDAEGYLVVYQGSRQSCANCFLL